MKFFFKLIFIYCFSNISFASSDIDGLIKTSQIIETRSKLLQDRMLRLYGKNSLLLAAKEGDLKTFQNFFNLDIRCDPREILNIVLKVPSSESLEKENAYQNIIDLLIERFPLQNFFYEKDIRYLYFLQFFHLDNNNQKYILKKYYLSK